MNASIVLAIIAAPFTILGLCAIAAIFGSGRAEGIADKPRSPVAWPSDRGAA